MGDADPVGSSSSRFLGWEGTPGPAAAPLCCGIPQEFCRNGISGGVSRCFPRSHTGMGHGAARAERPEWFSLRKSWECVPGISLELLFPFPSSSLPRISPALGVFSSPCAWTRTILADPFNLGHSAIPKSLNSGGTKPNPFWTRAQQGFTRSPNSASRLRSNPN